MVEIKSLIVILWLFALAMASVGDHAFREAFVCAATASISAYWAARNIWTALHPTKDPTP